MELRTSTRDMQFVLFEYLGISKLAEFEQWEDFDEDTFRMVLSEANKFAAGVLAPLNQDADAEGVKFEDGVVKVPESFHSAYEQYCENGWTGIHANPEYGGQGFPLTVAIASMEGVVGSCCSFTFTPELTGAAAHVIESFCDDAMKDLYLEKMYTGQWGGTMCLTEAGAGTAVGDVKTKATPNADGSWNIEGTKIFITSGDQDLTENIIHLVLAKTPDAPPGIKGISLFVVPKMRINDDGSVGESNDVTCTGIEHKMGIHASPTCSLAFGENGKCKGYLVGEETRGIIYMFQMMNEARVAVGIQGLALGSQAYETSLAYSKERIQGTDIKNFKDPDAPRVPIVKHPDVRRMLMNMKAYTEGARGLLYSVAFWLDMHHATKDENYINMVELLTPICKAYCSDTGFRVTELGIQVHGGYGYCSEYGMEQLCRDEKIASIYEGANGIQALDLVGRKLGMKGGAVLMSFMTKLNKFLAKTKKHEALGDLAKDLEKAKNKLMILTMGIPKKAKADPYYPVGFASPYLEMFGEVTFAFFLLDMAVVAHEKLQALYAEKGADTEEAQKALNADHPDATFYSGKIQTAKFFIHQILPGVYAKAMAFESGDTSLMDIEL